jgi:hypothetical protein
LFAALFGVVDRFAILRTGAFCAVFLAVGFVVVFAPVFLATARFATVFFAGIRFTAVVLATGLVTSVFFATTFVAGTFFVELLVVAGVPPAVFDVFDGGAGFAVVTRFDGLVALGLRSAECFRSTTLSVPGAETKLDCSPEGHRTVSMFPRTSITTPARDTCPTFVAANSIWSPTAGTKPSPIPSFDIVRASRGSRVSSAMTSSTLFPNLWVPETRFGVLTPLVFVVGRSRGHAHPKLELPSIR